MIIMLCGLQSQFSSLSRRVHVVITGRFATRRPVGATPFCNTIQPLLSSLSSDLKLGQLDDLTFGGPVQDVTLDVAETNRSGAAMGLTLNTSKCEIIAHPDFSVTDDLLQSFARVDITDNHTSGCTSVHWICS